MTTIEPVVKDGKTQSKLTSYLHFDPRGLIPAFFVNSALSMAVDSIDRMRSWIEKHGPEYYQRKASQACDVGWVLNFKFGKFKAGMKVEQTTFSNF